MQERPDGSGTWRLRAYVGRDPVTDSPIQEQETFHGTEARARKALAALVTRVESRKFDRTRVTVGQMLDRWLAHVEGVGKARPKTAYEYGRKIERRLKPAFGATRLDRLEPDVIDAYYRQWLADGLSPSTVRAYHAILSAACHQAVKWGWLDRSPLDRVTAPTPRTHEMKVPTPKQLGVLIRTAEKTDPVLATAIALAALSGARRGELAGLRWSDVDLVAGTMRISKSLVVVDGEAVVGETKGRQARYIALDDTAVEILRERWAYMVELSERAESPLVDDPYVLSYMAHGGRPAGPDTLTHGFASVCRTLEAPARKRAKETGVKVKDSELWPYRFHDLRHFSVTTLIANGVDVKTVADRHGHAQAAMTLNRYAHALPERDRVAAGVLGRALRPG
jgi:integrase